MKTRTIKITILVLILSVSFGVWLRRSHVNAPAAAGSAPTQPSRATASNSSRAARDAAVGSSGALAGETDSSPVQLVTDDQAGFRQRAAAVAVLTTNLSSAEQQRLQAFLSQRSPADDDQLGQVLKNRLLDVLCGWDPPPEWLADTLTGIYDDAGQHPVMRDYAVQHMAVLYEQLNPASSEPSRDRKAIQEVLWKALAETNSSIAGTALLGLTRLSSRAPMDFDRTRIGDTALQLAGDAEAGELSRITAFQVCAELRVTRALPLLLRTAQKDENLPVRISAIGALGSWGGDAVKALLTKILDGDEDRLKPPAEAALREIIQREQPTATTNRKS